MLFTITGSLKRFLMLAASACLLFGTFGCGSDNQSSLASLLLALRGNPVVPKNAVGPTSSTTLRTLGFAPDNANSLFVSKNGNDATGTGSREQPFLTINRAKESCDATRQNVVVLDSGTYDEIGFEFAGNFRGLYAAPGAMPSLSLLRNEDFLVPDLTVLSERNFLNGAVGATSCVLLPEGGALIAYVDGSDSKGKYKVFDSSWGEVKSGVFHNAATFWTAAALLADNRVIITFEDNAETNTGKYAIIDASRDPVAGETAFGPVNSDYPDVAVMADGHVIVTYRNGGGKFVVLDESLSVIKNDGVFHADYTADMAVSALPDGTVLIAYQANGTITSYAAYYTVLDPANGWSATVPKTLLRNNDTYDLDTAVYDNGKVLVAFKDEASPNRGKYLVLDSSYAVCKAEAYFNNAATAYPGVCVFGDGSVLLTYQGSDGRGKYKVIANVYSGISVTGSAVVNGMSISAADPLTHRLFNADAASLEIDWCDVSGFRHAGSVAGYYGIYSNSTVTLSNSRMFDSENCVYATGAVYVADSQFFANTGDAVNKAGSNVITVDHADFFNNGVGIRLEGNAGGATDSVKNSIFHDNVTFDITAGTTISVYNSVYDGAGSGVSAWPGCANGDPLYVDDAPSDIADINLNLQTILAGYDADSPARGLADDGRNAGSLDVEYAD